MIEYEPVIGLEIHAQLSTRTKMFCSCPTEYGAEPNTHVCPVCLGLPGALPAVNERAVEYAVRMGVATNCRIARRSVFARKNYFYPDCPKNYQITQYEIPLCSGGYLTAGENAVTIRIKRIHIEEDAAKLVHPGGEADTSYVDMNRAGVPLIEIVTEPDIRTPADAARVVEKLRSILRYLDICDGNMEEGSLRCDVNVSVRKTGTADVGVSTEIKNLNSFKAVERALEFEIDTQTKTLEKGDSVSHMTLLWDAGTLTCREMRAKEEADDYRYFPDPDLRVLDVPDDVVARVHSEMPELPDAKEDRFVTELGLPRYDANLLAGTKEIADYFEAVAGACGDAKAASNWVMGEVLHELNERRVDIDGLRVTPERLARLIIAVGRGTVSMPAAKDVFKEMADTGGEPDAIIAQKGIEQIGDDAELDAIINGVLDGHPDVVTAYLGGEEKLLKWLVGQTMRVSRGRANPQRAAARLEALLEKRRRGT